ncbi:MAG: Ig-like domain-containing protein, partial [Chloroflexota bacterium]
GIKVTVLGGSENPVPEGTVTISGDAICRFTLFYGSGGCKVNFSSPGQKNILVEYSGDNYYSSKPVFKIIEVEK